MIEGSSGCMRVEERWERNGRRTCGRTALLPVLSLLVGFAVAGCEQTTIHVVSPEDPGSAGDPGSPEEPDPSGGSTDAPTAGQIVHPDWPVVLPGGSVLTDLEVRSDRLKYRIRTDLGYEGVYEHLHPQLIEDGWEREDLDWKKSSVEAEYERNGWELDLKVERDSRDRVKVELEIDD